MTIRVSWHLPAGGDIEIEHNGLSSDEGLVSLVLICLFTDARAAASDEIPDGTEDRRGWPGDSFSDFSWGSKLWLIEREKLTEAVRLRAENYANLSMQPLIHYGYARATQVIATIPRMNWLALSIVLTRPNNSALTVEINKRWGVENAV
ncbi:phage GP46 family protein [Pectobacterium aroidearum]|uniref:phage GP46 family protein n=1 Tax=Pectobacterium aroidearum TaxID=1201031 RepID=UPI0015F0E67C|nr:phage GP46 family protein [Pectobacterium aroidearum]MBA5235294.1 phage GP46 family protein [Pectobacterium aroidearum]